MGAFITIIIAIFILAFGLFVWGENMDTQTCQQKYGAAYTLYESSANSSIRYCKAPDGTLKSL